MPSPYSLDSLGVTPSRQSFSLVNAQHHPLSAACLSHSNIVNGELITVASSVKVNRQYNEPIRVSHVC